VFLGPLLLALVISGVTLYRDISAERQSGMAASS
jgi:hypothetical protein